MTDRPTLVLICGLPGAGKTTLASKLAGGYPAVRLCPDEWMADLEVSFYDEAFRDRLERRFWLLAQDLLSKGQSVVLESGFWLRSDRYEKRLGAHRLGATVELHFLDVSLDELWRRLHQRNQLAEHGAVPATREQLIDWAGYFQTPDADEQALFDTPRKEINL